VAERSESGGSRNGSAGRAGSEAAHGVGNASEPAVRAGMFARAAIKAPAATSIVVPVDAVLIKDGKTFIVYVKTGADLFVAHKVQIGRSIEGHVEILSGVVEGEDIVTKGALLIDGAAEQLL
jgi:cobalt-zinc-cadmium efflux system membrane fusion protein